MAPLLGSQFKPGHLGAVGTVAVCLLFSSCNQKMCAPAIASLEFPVIVLFENSSILVCSSREELTKMHSNYLILNNRDPRLIDSKLNVYVMEKLRSVHGGLWLTAHPSEITEVTFELRRQK